MVAVALLVAIAEAFVAPAPSHRASVPMRVPVHRGLAPGIAAAPQLSPLTLGLQSVHAAAVCAGMAFPEQADGFAASAWRAFDACPLTHERMFEASLSVSCFVLFILGFESLHKVVDPRRWRLDGAMPKDPLHGFTRQWWKATVPAATYLGAIWLYHQLGMGELLFGLPPAEVRWRPRGRERRGRRKRGGTALRPAPSATADWHACAPAHSPPLQRYPWPRHLAGPPCYLSACPFPPIFPSVLPAPFPLCDASPSAAFGLPCRC
jgi:hypothetical protein